MKFLNRNTKTNPKFNFPELIGMFCTLFLTISILLGGNSVLAVSQQANPNQHNSQNKHFQDSKAASQANILFAFDSIEESEPTDENVDEKTIESGFTLNFSAPFLHNNLKSSFANFSQSLQKRTSIPFFLLHHSLKIPAA